MYRKKFSTNKAVGFQIGWWNRWSYINLEFRWNRKCDHAGMRFGIELFGFYLYVEFYDIRHWNDDKNKWEIYE